MIDWIIDAIPLTKAARCPGSCHADARVTSGSGVVGGAEAQNSGVSGAVAMDGKEPDILPGFFPKERAGEYRTRVADNHQ